MRGIIPSGLPVGRIEIYDLRFALEPSAFGVLAPRRKNPQICNKSAGRPSSFSATKSNLSTYSLQCPMQTKGRITYYCLFRAKE
jgi:hypothetical protein